MEKNYVNGPKLNFFLLAVNFNINTDNSKVKKYNPYIFKCGNYN